MMVMDDEYTSDADEQQDAVRLGLLDYDATHCKHGTFTGHWAGPDYMCSWCEMGVTDEEYAEAMAERARFRERRSRAPLYLKVALRLHRTTETMDDGPAKDAVKARVERHILHWIKTGEGR